MNAELEKKLLSEIPHIIDTISNRVNDTDAPDLVQDCIEAIWRRLLKEDKPIADFSAWVYGLCKNKRISYYRQKASYNNMLANMTHRQETEYEGSTASLVANDILERIGNDRYRRFLVNYYLLGMTCREIAQMENCSLCAVYNVWKRAMKAARSLE